MAKISTKHAFICFLFCVTARISRGHDEHSCHTELPTECDFIVVGAGAAGTTVAARLSEDSQRTVCLFEAGIKDTNNEISPLIQIPRLFLKLRPGPITYNHTTVPQPGFNGRAVACGMGKALGGSTSHNGMAFYRGFKADFDYWAENGATGWSYDDVFPYFLKMENNVSPKLKDSPYHSTCGPFTVSHNKGTDHHPLSILLTNTAKEIGMPIVDCNQPSPFGMCERQFAIKNGKRESTSTAYLHPIVGRRNLFIITEALVEKIIITGNPKKAWGIRFSKNGKKYDVKARLEVIVSGGSYGSAQLLQLSGIGPKSLLDQFKIPCHADLPVGNNFQNRIAMSLVILLDYPTETNEVLQKPEVLSEYVERKTGYLSQKESAPMNIFFDTTKQKNNWPELLTLFRDGSSSPPRDRNVSSILMWSMHPVGRGTVHIQSTDPRTPPVINPRYLEEEEDVQTLVDALKQFQNFTMNSPSLKAVNAVIDLTDMPDTCKQMTSYSDEQWRCILKHKARDGGMPASTCKMGSINDNTSVTDPFLRVKGINSLRVADTSVMPELTSGPTMAPTIMIGEKAADMIKQAHINVPYSNVKPTDNNGNTNKFPPVNTGTSKRANCYNLILFAALFVYTSMLMIC